MASTNKTTHYELSQYIGTDKPTYLTDYNQDMDKIDAGIYGAKSLADVNSTSIGTLSNLTTTDKTSLVGAVNEVNGKTDDIGTLSNLTTTDKTSLVGAVNEVNGKADGIGTLANLTTTDKTSLVGAVNEVNSNVGTLANLTTTNKSSSVGAINEVNSNVGTLSNLTTTDKTSIVNAINEVLSDFNLNIFAQPTNATTSAGTISVNQLNTARNTKGNIGKIYGPINISNIPLNTNTITITFQTTFRPDSDINIQSVVFNRQYGNNTDVVSNVSNLSISTNGVVSITIALYSTTTTVEFRIIPCLLFIKDFGDQPDPQI